MKNSNNNYSISFASLLTLLFVTLKLLGKIDWSWGWVISPILISWGIMLVAIIILLLFSVFNK